MAPHNETDRLVEECFCDRSVNGRLALEELQQFLHLDEYDTIAKIAQSKAFELHVDNGAIYIERSESQPFVQSSDTTPTYIEHDSLIDQPTNPMGQQVVEGLRQIWRDPGISELQDVLDAIDRLPLPDDVWPKVTALLTSFETGHLRYKKKLFLETLADWLGLTRQDKGTDTQKPNSEKAAQFLSGFHLASKFLDGKHEALKVLDILKRKHGLDWNNVAIPAHDAGLIDYKGDCPILTAKGHEFLKQNPLPN